MIKGRRISLVIVFTGLLMLGATLSWQALRSSSPTASNQIDLSLLEKAREENDALRAKLVEIEAAFNELKNQITADQSNAPKVAGARTTSSSSIKTSSESPKNGLVNINSDSLNELTKLTGIGPTKAQAIIDYRNLNGGFKSKEELKNVKGIGDATYKKIESQISL